MLSTLIPDYSVHKLHIIAQHHVFVSGPKIPEPTDYLILNRCREVNLVLGVSVM